MAELTLPDQHIYHHYDSDGIRIALKVEKNTKGFNYEASITGAKSPEEAIVTLKAAQGLLEATYGSPPPVATPSSSTAV